MTTATVKDEARRLVDRLPDDATWEDLQYQIYFRQAVEAGLKDSQEGRIVPLEEARRRFGLGTKCQASGFQSSAPDTLTGASHVA
jgi:predicted transcriptional regulator